MTYTSPPYKKSSVFSSQVKARLALTLEMVGVIIGGRMYIKIYVSLRPLYTKQHRKPYTQLLQQHRKRYRR